MDEQSDKPTSPWAAEALAARGEYYAAFALNNCTPQEKVEVDTFRYSGVAESISERAWRIYMRKIDLRTPQEREKAEATTIARTLERRAEYQEARAALKTGPQLAAIWKAYIRELDSCTPEQRMKIFLSPGGRAITPPSFEDLDNLPNKHTQDIKERFRSAVDRAMTWRYAGSAWSQPVVDWVVRQPQEKSLERPIEAQGIKHDTDKLPLDLIPKEAMDAMARALQYGATKYSRSNWRGGMAWSRVYAAAMRHMTAWNDGQDKDEESGLSHLDHAICCLAFLSTYEATKTGEDDRYKANGT